MTQRDAGGCLAAMKQLVSRALSALAGLAVAGLLVFSITAHAEGMHSLMLKDGWSRETTANARVGGGYLTIMNHGEMADRLLSVRADHAGMSEVHTMIMQDDVMVMRPVEDPLVIEAGAMLELQPGGLHLMFMQLEQPHVAGESLDVVLVFEHAGERTVTLEVLSMRDSMERMAESGGSHGDHDSGHSDHDSGHSDHDSGHSHN